MPAIDWDSILSKLPMLLTRKDVGIHFGHVISKKYLANLDSMEEGPNKVYISGKAVYTKEDFVEWLKARERDSWA